MKTVLVNYFFKELDPTPFQKLKEKYPELDFIICTSPESLYEHLPEAEILVATRVDNKMLEAAPRLKWLQSLLVGVDHYDLEAFKNRGVLVTNSHGVSASLMAEYAICSMIMLARRFPEIYHNKTQHKWIKYPQKEIYGATVGLLGFGAIARAIAEKAKALGMNVISVKRTPEKSDLAKIYPLEQIDEVFKQSDYVINLLPHTPETTELIDLRLLTLMNPSACFINIGRGKTVKQDDLIFALQSGIISGFVGDVFYDEPLSPKNPLWSMDNVFISPHVAGENVYLVEKIINDVFDPNIQTYLSGCGNYINVVDTKKGY